LQATKLPLSKWFLAEHLISQNKNDFSALSLSGDPPACVLDKT
jgi:hypothetical protein